MNPERIPVEELEKLMLKKAFAELSEQEKELVLTQLASPAEYNDLRNTLIKIRQVFSDDRIHLKMPASGKDILMSTFRNRNASYGQLPMIKPYQSKWMWAFAASLLLIVSLILVNDRYDFLKKRKEIALYNNHTESRVMEELPVSVDDEWNKISEQNSEDEVALYEQESSFSGISNNTLSNPDILDAIKTPNATKSEVTYYQTEEQNNSATISATETENTISMVSFPDNEMPMEYAESEPVIITTQKDLKKSKTVKGISATKPYTERSQTNKADRKAFIRKSFLCTDI